MPVTIDEVTAEIAPAEKPGAAPRPAATPPSAAAQLRLHREHLAHLMLRATRLAAD